MNYDRVIFWHDDMSSQKCHVFELNYSTNDGRVISREQLLLNLSNRRNYHINVICEANF